MCLENNFGFGPAGLILLIYLDEQNDSLPAHKSINFSESILPGYYVFRLHCKNFSSRAFNFWNAKKKKNKQF